MGNVTYVILLLVFIFREITADEECLVTVKQGQLRGVKKTSVYNKTYCAFYGIPYAKPPVGEKRFKLAEPAEAWNGTYNATKEKSYCPQVSMSTHEFVGDEDCLYMNVYTNKLPKGNEERNATTFSIHGGGFIGGTAGTYEYGPDYFLNADVLLVTIQYRLGILGFLSIPDLGIPGNNGIKDQNLALRWVHDNIEYFGGDANNVTIIGESAGAVSVHLHLLANMSKDLFQRAIMQSGSALSPWAYKTPEQMKDSLLQVVRNLGCSDTSTSKEILHCLNAEALDLLITISTLAFFLPTIENESSNGDEALITKSPHELCSSGVFQDKAVLLGTTAHEESLFMAAFPPSDDETFESLWEAKAAGYISKNKINKTSEKRMKECIKGKYFENEKLTIDEIERFSTDSSFLVEQYATAKACAKFSSQPVFYYYFQYDGDLATLKINNIHLRKVPTHADENGYQFHMTNTPPVSNSEAWQVSRRIVSLWTSFAKKGAPCLKMDPDGVNLDWKPFTIDNQVYLDINKTFSMKKDLLKDRLELWETCR